MTEQHNLNPQQQLRNPHCKRSMRFTKESYEALIILKKKLEAKAPHMQKRKTDETSPRGSQSAVPPGQPPVKDSPSKVRGMGGRGY